LGPAPERPSMKKTSQIFLACLLAFLPLAGRAAPFAIATRDIQLNGYDLFIDSFNSADPLRSTGGQYDPLKGGGDASIIGSEAGVNNANNLANVQLFGRLKTGLPFVLAVPKAQLEARLQQSGQTGIEPGFQTTDLRSFSLMLHLRLAASSRHRVHTMEWCIPIFFRPERTI
jgi:hypothetical protein